MISAKRLWRKTRNALDDAGTWTRERGEDLRRPLTEGASALGGAIADSASSAWDVLSGERDWRRSQAAAKEAREWTAEREDNAVQRRYADLAAAGINPSIAGEVGGAQASASPVPTSHSAQSWSSTLGLAGSLVSGGVNAYKGVAESGLIRANTARSLAETARTLKTTDPEVARIIAGTVVDQVRVPNIQAETAGKTLDNAAKRRDIPRQQAEGAYYKSHGEHAIAARNSPHGMAYLGGAQGSKRISQAVGKVNDFRAKANSAVDQFFSRSVNSANSLLNRIKPSGRKRGRAR